MFIVLLACEKPVTIDIPQKPSRLVINGWVGNDSIISVHVGKSRYSLAPRDSWSQLLETYTVKNAVPVVYENNIPVDTLVYDAVTYQYRSTRSKRIRQGYTYRVKVNAPDFPEAWAETPVPSQSVITKLERVRNARTNSAGQPEDEITITLDDPAGEENFYLVQIFTSAYNIGHGYPVSCVRTTDKDIEMMRYDTDPMDPDNCFNGNELLMKDVHFNGRQKVLKLYVESSLLPDYVDPNNGNVNRPYIYVYRITKDHFKFMKSFAIYWSTDENPFAEPVNVFSNVQNGYGVFSTYTKMTDTLR